MILNYIDLIWLPIALFIVHKEQRIITAAFFVSCFIMMRLQIEMMLSIGYPNGFLPLLKFSVQNTALVVYMFFYIAYIAVTYWSKGTNKHILLAASISIFFAAMLTSMVIMVL